MIYKHLVALVTEDRDSHVVGDTKLRLLSIVIDERIFRGAPGAVFRNKGVTVEGLSLRRKIYLYDYSRPCSVSLCRRY